MSLKIYNLGTRPPDKSALSNKKSICYYSKETYAVNTQKNRLRETF